MRRKEDSEIASRHLPRIFLDADLGGSSVRLDPDTVHYLRHVLRLRAGSEIVAFDGRGSERVAAIASLSKREPVLTLGESRRPLPESPADITLVQGLIKGDGMDTVVQKATELGVRRIVAARTDFSVVKLDADRAARRLAHWQRVARSACEQSQRHYPPVIDFCDSLREALECLPAATVMIALDNRSDGNIGDIDPDGHPVAMIVGPEGGFSPAETDRLDSQGCHTARLGPRILRAGTAAITACATAQLLWGDFVR